MAQFFRSHTNIVIGIGAGIVIGASATIIIQHLTSSIDAKLAILASHVSTLQQQISSLQAKLDEKGSLKRGKRSYGDFYSAKGSSGEEDEDAEDEFEEALEGRDYVTNFSSQPQSPASLTSDEYFSLEEDNVAPEVPTGGEAERVFAKVDKLFEGTDSDKEEAYNLLRNKEKEFSTVPDYRWRLAKATYFLSQIEGTRGNIDTKQSLVYEASNCACKALQLKEDDANIHKWCAITLGSVGDYESTQVKIQNGFKFKQHIERAIELNPSDPSSHYLLGRWCFGVYMLSWIERKVAATLFATPPTSTVEEALEHFIQADKLNKSKWKENMLYIAKCYIEQKKYYDAVVWLDAANQVKTVSADDRTSQVEVDKLLSQYSGYR